MKYNITPNGNLELIAEDEDKDELAELWANPTHRDHGFMADLLEYTGWPGNGHLYQVQPEWIAALTDAPILSDDVQFNDDGMPSVTGNVWWFPNYAIESFAETLMRDGRVLFHAAPENASR